MQLIRATRPEDIVKLALEIENTYNGTPFIYVGLSENVHAHPSINLMSYTSDDGSIAFNVSSQALGGAGLSHDDETGQIWFTARFGGKPHTIVFGINDVLGICDNSDPSTVDKIINGKLNSDDPEENTLSDESVSAVIADSLLAMPDGHIVLSIMLNGQVNNIIRIEPKDLPLSKIFNNLAIGLGLDESQEPPKYLRFIMLSPDSRRILVVADQEKVIVTDGDMLSKLQAVENSRRTGVSAEVLRPEFGEGSVPTTVTENTTTDTTEKPTESSTAQVISLDFYRKK